MRFPQFHGGFPALARDSPFVPVPSGVLFDMGSQALAGVFGVLFGALQIFKLFFY